MLKNKTLLITGGTGSFGKAALRLFLKNEFKEIRIFSRDEKKQDDLRREINNEKVKFYIGDVRDISSVNSAMMNVNYVFHAAALKQVPSCEFFPMEAVRTNVIGTDNVLTSAIQYKVEKVTVLSTDKAVYPVNAMGISKAMMEKVAISKSRTAEFAETTIMGTRYGNVMGSRGSVIPLFIEQIKEGKPITVTDANMTRYLMSIDNAVELVLFAFNNANQGDIFVQKAPAATIGNLAQALVEIFDANNPINIIGTRHGEKAYETLVSREEMASAIDMGDYYRLPADNRNLNYNNYFTDGSKKITKSWEYNSQNTRILTVPEIKTLLLSLDSVQKELKAWSLAQ